MRTGGRAVVAAVAALVVGLAVSWVAASWLRSATPEANLLWGVAPPAKTAVWTLAGAHGAALHVEAGAEVDEGLADIGSRLGELLGGESAEIPTTPRADLAVRLAPLSILACVGLVLVGFMRRSGAAAVTEAVVGSALAGAVYGIGLAGLAATSSAGLGVDLSIVRAGVEASVSVGESAVAGVVWGSAFALIGGLTAPAVKERLAPSWRALYAGLFRASWLAAVVAVGGLILMAVTRGGGGGGLPGDPSLQALAVGLLFLNVIAAAVVLSHGATMDTSFTAGPLSEWSRVGYTSDFLPSTKWALALVPLVAGFAAGRVMRRKSGGASLAVAFGAVWGLGLGALAVLLRVRVLSSFDLGSLGAGGGASIDPLLAAVLGFAIGTVTSFIGIISGNREPRAEPVMTQPVAEQVPPTQPRACPACGRPVAAADRFCSSCGQPA